MNRTLKLVVMVAFVVLYGAWGNVSLGNSNDPRTDTAQNFDRHFDNLTWTSEIKRPGGNPPAADIVTVLHAQANVAATDCPKVQTAPVNGPCGGTVTMFQGRTPTADGKGVPATGSTSSFLVPTVFVGDAVSPAAAAGAGSWAVHQSLMFRNASVPKNGQPNGLAFEPHPAKFPYSDEPQPGSVDIWGPPPPDSNFGYFVYVDTPSHSNYAADGNVKLEPQGNGEDALTAGLGDYRERYHFATIFKLTCHGQAPYVHSRFDWRINWQFDLAAAPADTMAVISTPTDAPIQGDPAKIEDPTPSPPNPLPIPPTGWDETKFREDAKKD